MNVATTEDLPLEVLQSGDFFECQECGEVFETVGEADAHERDWARTHVVA